MRRASSSRPGDLDEAVVGGEDAREDLDQGRLPRAVASEERVHLAAPKLDGHVAERLRAREALPHSPGTQDDRAGAHPSRLHVARYAALKSTGGS